MRHGFGLLFEGVILVRIGCIACAIVSLLRHVRQFVQQHMGAMGRLRLIPPRRNVDLLRQSERFHAAGSSKRTIAMDRSVTQVVVRRARGALPQIILWIARQNQRCNERRFVWRRALTRIAFDLQRLKRVTGWEGGALIGGICAFVAGGCVGSGLSRNTR
jgi:hypothetical protein